MPVDLSFQQLFGYIQSFMSPYYALQLKTQFLAQVISAQALLLALTWMIQTYMR